MMKTNKLTSVRARIYAQPMEDAQGFAISMFDYQGQKTVTCPVIVGESGGDLRNVPFAIIGSQNFAKGTVEKLFEGARHIDYIKGMDFVPYSNQNFKPKDVETDNVMDLFLKLFRFPNVGFACVYVSELDLWLWCSRRDLTTVRPMIDDVQTIIKMMKDQ